jgi:ABC-type Fe3+-hydroxamate transport system substrate-binding protein
MLIRKIREANDDYMIFTTHVTDDQIKQKSDEIKRMIRERSMSNVKDSRVIEK